jgi:hypothetical protein
MKAEPALGAELVKLERQYWDAIREKDASVATALSDEPCLVVGSRGVSEIDRQALAGMLEDGSFELQDFDLDNIRVRKLADDVAIVAYEVEEALRVEGEEVQLEAYDASVWVRRNGGWVCALHTETIAGDPFGRH